jgi:hypothetical protein
MLTVCPRRDKGSVHFCSPMAETQTLEGVKTQESVSANI